MLVALSLSHVSVASADPAIPDQATPHRPWESPISGSAPPATLVITNETDATLTITLLLHEGGRSVRLLKTVPPRRIISFFNQLPRGVVHVEAAPACVPGVSGAQKPLVVSGTGQYRLTFMSRDFGKSMILDRPNCGSDESLLQGECHAENRDIDLQGTPGRVLDGDMIADHPRMTVETCVKRCARGNFAYAALQYGRWCFCGNAPGKKIDPASCAMPCAGDLTQTCGGAWANSIYSVRNFTGPRKEATEAPAALPELPKETCPEGYNAYGCGRR